MENKQFDEKDEQQCSKLGWPVEVQMRGSLGPPPANVVRQNTLPRELGAQFRHAAVKTQSLSFAPQQLQTYNPVGFASNTPEWPPVSYAGPTHRRGGIKERQRGPATPGGWNLGKLSFEKLDPHFPKVMIQLQLFPEEVDRALTDMQSCFKRLSIQAKFKNNPAAARLRTLENIELYVTFFAGADGKVLVSIQRRRGDYLDAKRYIHWILEAAKGTASKKLANAVPSNENIRKFEGILDCRYKVPYPRTPVPVKDFPWRSPPTAEESMILTLETIHTSLTSPLMDRRKVGLDDLLVLTDLEKTLSQTAIASSLVVLAGKSPVPELQQVCTDIQSVLVWVIMKQEFPGDDIKIHADMDPDIIGFMPSESTLKDGRSRYYDEYFSEMFRLTLRVLANSIEVLQMFRNSSSLPDPLNVSCTQLEGSFGTGMVEALVRIIGNAKFRLLDAYLACRALRLLLEASPELRSAFRGNTVFAASVRSAIIAGRDHNPMLSETKTLQSLFG